MTAVPSAGPTSDDATRTPRLWPWVLAALCTLGAAALGWQGAWTGSLGAAGCGAVLAIGLLHLAADPRLRAPAGSSSDASASMTRAADPRLPLCGAQAADRTSLSNGAGVTAGSVNPMLTEVVPVWARQLEATRTNTDTGLNNVLGAFVEMTSALDTLLGSLEATSPSAQPGAVDQAVGAASEPLTCLMAPSLRAFAQRDKAYAEIHHAAGVLQELDQLARQAKELGRHTRLVAFNASIDANRERTRDHGNEAVAQEMRLLAQRLSENGEAAHRLATELLGRLNASRGEMATLDVATDELRMELEQRAREALQTLISAVGASLSASAPVREASTALRQHLDRAFVHFQFGDRVSQMLSIVGNDMNNFVDWLIRNPGATLDDATEWLRRLENSYTMDEQRNHHHAVAHVDRGRSVEYF
jgi:methyl-accepting chemotaxis protein